MTVFVCAKTHRPPREVHPIERMYLAWAESGDAAMAGRPVEISKMPRKKGVAFPRARYWFSAADNTENKMIKPPRRVMVSKAFMIEISSSFPAGGSGDISFLL